MSAKTAYLIGAGMFVVLGVVFLVLSDDWPLIFLACVQFACALVFTIAAFGSQMRTKP